MTHTHACRVKVDDLDGSNGFFSNLKISFSSAFFRRNGYNEQVSVRCLSVQSLKTFLFLIFQLRYTCRVTGTCPITITTRRHCSACRLNKCFARGMKKELIRSLASIQQSTAAGHRRTMPVSFSVFSLQMHFKFS